MPIQGEGEAPGFARQSHSPGGELGVRGSLRGQGGGCQPRYRGQGVGGLPATFSLCRQLLRLPALPPLEGSVLRLFLLHL